MIRLGNLSGTLMLNDIPILRFSFEKGMLLEYELLCEDSRLLPLEFKDKKVTEERIRLFWEARITPDSRQHLKECMLKNNFQCYDAEQLIKHQKGRCIDDQYWLHIE